MAPKKKRTLTITAAMTVVWATTRMTAQWLQVTNQWRGKTRLRLRRNLTPVWSEQRRPSVAGLPPSQRPSGKPCCAQPQTAWSRSSTYPSCLRRCCEPCRTSQRSSPWSLQVTPRSSRRLSFWAACASGRRAPRLLRAAGCGMKRHIRDRKGHMGILHYCCVLWLAPTNREDQCLIPQTYSTDSGRELYCSPYLSSQSEWGIVLGPLCFCAACHVGNQLQKLYMISASFKCAGSRMSPHLLSCNEAVDESQCHLSQSSVIPCQG